MIETIIILAGLCITFLPALLYFKYLLSHVSTKTKFDYHLELVKDKKGRLGIIIAYLERIILGIYISSLGILMSEFFDNDTVLKILIISLVLYIIVKYIDEKNEK